MRIGETLAEDLQGFVRLWERIHEDLQDFGRCERGFTRICETLEDFRRGFVGKDSQGFASVHETLGDD